jgi:hypothetical protein
VTRSIALLCATALLVLSTAVAAQPRDPRRWNFDERYYREDDPPESVEGATKMCSVYVPDNWRDTFPVPRTWRWSDCRDFAQAVGATHIHLVCIFAEGDPKTSIGGPGDLPEPDCGWGRRRR